MLKITENYLTCLRANNNNRQAGFTLIELSLVFIVIALLVSAVLGGKVLIEQSKIRKIISEINQYQQAIIGFQQQYNGLPGDLKNAASFFGQASDCTAPYIDEAGTCDGNGDGKIGNGTDSDFTEPFTLWNQLSISKNIGSYYSGGGNGCAIGTNIPKSNAIENMGYSVTYQDDPFGYTDELGRSYQGNNISIGSCTASTNDTSDSTFTPQKAFYIDDKIDDGVPDQGMLLTRHGSEIISATDCISNNSGTLSYNFINDDIVCAIKYRLSF